MRRPAATTALIAAALSLAPIAASVLAERPAGAAGLRATARCHERGGACVADERVTAAGDPMEEARRAASQLDFTATVDLRWVDDAGRHEASLEVQVGAGRTHIAGPAPVDAGAAGRMVRRAGGWAVVWPGASGPLQLPPLDRKYDLAVAEGPVVAGRPTHQVEVRERGYVRERLAVDTATGLVLRRELVNRAGATARLVEVQRLTFGPASTSRTPPRPVAHDRPRRVAVDRLPPPLRVPPELAGGYRRSSAYVRGGQVQVLYSDGLHGLSLFVQRGRLAALPPAAERVSIGRAGAAAWAWSGGEVVTWQRGGVVYGAVGDAPEDELLAAARSVPGPGRVGAAATLRASCRRLADVLAG